MGFRKFIFRKYRKSVTKKHQLNYLFWECTLRCNLNCLHCGSDCTKVSGIPDMPVVDFKKVLDNIKQSGEVKDLTVCITGGEPLIRNDLEEAGKEIIKHGYRWGIVTNAMLLSPERFVSLLNAGLSSISFSLDGLEKNHTYLRQNVESFKKTENAIDMAVAFQKKHPGKLVFDVITCVNQNNLNELSEIRDFLISKGVTMWRIFSIFPQGRGAQNIERLALSKADYIKQMEFIKETRKLYGDKIHLNYACEGYLGKYELKVRDYFFFCRGGINIGSVWSDGSVSACLSVRSKDLIQGNVYEENFMDIWNKKFHNQRNREWAKIGKCKKCTQWKNCLGNGLHLHSSLTAEVDFCNFQMLN